MPAKPKPRRDTGAKAELAMLKRYRSEGCPKNRVPLRGVIGGYIGIYGDYIRVQVPIFGFWGPSTII